MRKILLLLSIVPWLAACDPSPSESAPAAVAKSETKSKTKTSAKAEVTPEAKPAAKGANADPPADNVNDTKPVVAAPELPSARPKTLVEAKKSLVAVAAGGDISALHQLVESPGWLAVSYQADGARKRHTKIRTDDAAAFTASFSGEPWQPVHYTAALAANFVDEATLDAELHLDEAKSTITFTPDAQFTVAFVFAKNADDTLFLVGVELADEEP